MNTHNSEEILKKFIQDGGYFVFIGNDGEEFRVFGSTLKTALMGMKMSLYWSKPSDINSVINQIERFRKNAHNVAVIMKLERTGDYSSLRDLRVHYSREEVPITVLMKETGKDVITLLGEMGANGIIILPYSAINVTEKIANTIKPSGLNEIIQNCDKLLANKQYESVLNICEIILRRKPNSTVAYMLKGDAYSGMAESKSGQEAQKEREKALIFYTLAWRGNNKYLEPLKRLANFHKAQKNTAEQLRFLLELDELSPLNVDRRKEIGAILSQDLGQEQEAKKYLTESPESTEK